MQEYQKDTEEIFFQWLSNAVSPSLLEAIKRTYLPINTMLIKRRALPDKLVNVKQIEQIQSAKQMAKSIFANKKQRAAADKMLSLYLTYLGENKSPSHSREELNVSIQDGWIRFTYTNAADFGKTIPAYCEIAGTVYEGKSWTQILVKILNREIENHNSKLDVLYKNSLIPDRTNRAFIVKNEIEGLYCVQLKNGYWVNVNHNSPRMLELIQKLCLHCGYTNEQIILCGEYKRSSLDKKKSSFSAVTQTSAYSNELLEQAKVIISNSFANGMRKDSIIAKKKFKAAYLEQIGTELSETIDIDDLAASVGYEYADKIYVLSEYNKAEIKALVQKAFESGCRVIFYEELYRRHMDFMTQAGIFTAELLKNILKRISPELVYRRSFFAVTSGDNLEDAIAACLEGKITRTYNEIKARLPYVDMSSIRFTCSQDSRFVWVCEGTYAFVQSLHLAESDVRTAEKVMEQDIENRGFSVIYRVCVDESKDLNPNISETALRDAIFLRYLSQKYERKRSMIVKPGASFCAPDIMNAYCQDLRKVTLGELLEYEKDMTEKATYSLAAAYENMLRIDKEHFVALDEIQFDIQAIDNALALYVNNSIIPLKSVKSFLAFPEIPEVPWNFFLLDSYCKHKSIRFRSMGGPAKGRPVGAIFPSAMKFDSYDELLAHVIAKSNLELREDDVCTFLSEHAYTLRRINPGGIIIKAQEIRNQKE